jgi:hypothetical protein
VRASDFIVMSSTQLLLWLVPSPRAAVKNKIVPDPAGQPILFYVGNCEPSVPDARSEINR